MGFLPVLPCFLICLIMLSFSKDIDCDYHCQDGPTVKSTDCYVVVGCDLSFPSISLSYEYRYIFRLDLNFTELATDDAVPRAPFLYSGIFWYYEDHNYDRYLFKAENLYCNYRHYCYNFYFSILNIQLDDAGTYQVDLKSTNSDSTAGPNVMQHTYRLFVYQPSTPLVCQGPSSSPSGSYHVTISCSITNGFPPINLEMLEPEGCDFQKHYTDENGIQELSVGITSCDQNSTVGCIAIQETMASLSTPQYSDRCEFNISKSNPVYQPPTTLVCEGPSSSPSTSYHVVLSCSITGGYPPINLEVIKPEGCDYQKYYTDNNGTKELSVYVTSCDKNSIVGCIATHEPLESLSTSQYDDRCEFKISRTDQDTKNIMTVVMIVIAIILVLSVIAIVYVYRQLRLDLNFTELATDDAVPRTPFLYSGTFRWNEDHTYDRYIFQVEFLYCDHMDCYFSFNFSILNIQLNDAGTYQVHIQSTNSDWTGGPTVLRQHTYRLFVYQPPSPLVCEGPSSSPSGSYHVTISCSIRNGFPPINLEMIEPYGCDFQKHYTDDNGIQELSINVTSCDKNSAVGCIATQETMASLSAPQYLNRCEYNISKSNPVYQPSTPLVCQGPSSSGSYRITISCLITNGFPPINLEMIEPDGCAFQKDYTDDNGIQELSINVMSCDQNSAVGCIATQEQLEFFSTPQYSGRCEFNISKSNPVELH
ncbi:uncharacterized protein [Apostichopus japonicus]|uniref:uncharacterized protein n=1 Tax=Stichopus japonicus TaxID=307972 RepID=UPI003AB5BC10